MFRGFDQLFSTLAWRVNACPKFWRTRVLKGFKIILVLNTFISMPEITFFLS